ncbi:sugar phosphate nucleotidyltransferase [soil metagenome]
MKAVILARGLGTRMRRDDGLALDADQAHAAASGVKALVSVGRPFIEYLLTSLADAGVRDVCLVIGPEHHTLLNHCEALPLQRFRIAFAIQERPLGTSDALRAARTFVGSDPFLLINSDNDYPVAALKTLVTSDEPALIGFEPGGLLRGNIEAERLRQFAIITTDSQSRLRSILEKPTDAERDRIPGPHLVSMNCWRFDPEIFAACEAIGPSPRGEWELTTAVQYGLERLGLNWRVRPADAPVWDLTSRGDIALVTAALLHREVRL